MERRYLFTLAHGELSLMEVASYFEARGVGCRFEDVSKEAAIFSASGVDVGRVAIELGGFYKLGEVLCSVERSRVSDGELLKGALDSCSFYEKLSDKMLWAVSYYWSGSKVNTSLIGFLESYFRDRLLQDGVRKARMLPFSRKSFFEVLSEDAVEKGLLDRGFEVLTAFFKDRYYFAKTLAIVDHEGFRFRDLKRPALRVEVSMPPKIAKLMVNLSGVHSGSRLLDPFCGTGTVLMEAAMLGVEAYGVDIDRHMVSDASANLKWLSKTYRLPRENFEVRCGDARRLAAQFEEESFDAVVTEPILLPPLRRPIGVEDARNMLSEAEMVYNSALAEMVKVVKKRGRIVISAPYVKTLDRRLFSFPLWKTAVKLGLKTYAPRGLQHFQQPFFPIGQEDQRVFRGIYVFEKVRS